VIVGAMLQLESPSTSRFALGSLCSWADASWIGWGERLSGIKPARWLAMYARTVEPIVRSDGLIAQLAATAPERSA
jgi:hypothetical protein